ncbi:MAG: hypothetical protein AAB356_05780 [Deltaproteobacteria bacterium]
MKRISRRIERLEERAGTGEPITLNNHTTIIGMDGKVEREKTETVRMGKGAQACNPTLYRSVNAY